MARIRNIKPELFVHYELYEAEVESGINLRAAFMGLLTVADREGRFHWKPRRIKLDVLPYDDVDFELVLSALEDAGFVMSYEVGGKKFGCIPSFLDHQMPSRTEPPSSIPGPDGSMTDFIAAPSNRIRATVYERHGYHCVYCGANLSEDKDKRRRCLEHVIPIAQDGSNHEDNLVLACKRCNAIKGARDPDQAGMRWPTMPDGTKYGHKVGDPTSDSEQGVANEGQHPVNAGVNIPLTGAVPGKGMGKGKGKGEGEEKSEDPPNSASQEMKQTPILQLWQDAWASRHGAPYLPNHFEEQDSQALDEKIGISYSDETKSEAIRLFQIDEKTCNEGLGKFLKNPNPLLVKAAKRTKRPRPTAQPPNPPPVNQKQASPPPPEVQRQLDAILGRKPSEAKGAAP